MANKRFYSFISHFVDIQPKELYSSSLIFVYFFILTFSIYILKPIKIAYFLRDNSPESVVIPYLLTALIMGFVVTLNSKMLEKFNSFRIVGISLLFFVINIIFFRVVFDQKNSWFPIIYWFWVEIFTVTSITQFWMIVNDFYSIRQARRVIGFFVKGGLLGGIAGSLVTGLLTGMIGTANLLLLCPFLLFLCVFISMKLGNHHKKENSVEYEKKAGEKTENTGIISGFKSIVTSKYLILLSGIMFIGIVVTTLIDFQFISIINSVEKFQNETNAITQFIGQFLLALLIFSFFFQTFFTEKVLKKGRIRSILLVTPLVLLLLGFGILLPGVLLIYWVLIFKGVDKGLAHSLNQSVRELLYIPVSSEVRAKAKVFIDMLVNKIGKGVAALMLVVLLFVFKGDYKDVTFILIICLLFWVGLIFSITREYIINVKDKVKSKWPDADILVADKIDMDLTKLVFDTIQSKKKSSVLYALNLFDLIKTENLSPELKSIISSKSDEVKAKSMGALLEVDGESLIPDFDDSLHLEEMSDEIEDILSLNVYQELMKEKVEEIIDKSGKKSEVSKMEAAKLLGMMNVSDSLIGSIIKLLKDDSIDVNIYALESSGKYKNRELVPYIIKLLDKTGAKSEAALVLSKYGEKIAGALKDYLADESVNLSIRKSIPDILARIGTQKAADFMVIELQKRDQDVYYEIITGLFRLKTNKQKIFFSEEYIVPNIFYLIKIQYEKLIKIQKTGTKKENLSQRNRLEQEYLSNLKYIFELLGLVYPYNDIMKAYQNICTGDSKSVDYAIELIDHLLKKDIKEFLLPLIEDSSFEEKAKKCKKKMALLKSI